MTKPWHERAAELLAAATPGPWAEDDCHVFSEPLADARTESIMRKMGGGPAPIPYGREYVCDCSQEFEQSDANAALIAAAPTLLTEALAERDELVGLVRELVNELDDVTDGLGKAHPAWLAPSEECDIADLIARTKAALGEGP